MFALMCRRHTSLAKRHHMRSIHHLPEGANIIEKTSSFDEVFSGGGRWIRTTEGIASRFTVCPLWPLGNSPIFDWSWWTDSNPRPADYKSAALPTELHQHLTGPIIIANTPYFVNKNFLRACDCFSRTSAVELMNRIEINRIL